MTQQKPWRSLRFLLTQHPTKTLVFIYDEKIIARIEKSHTRTPGFSEGFKIDNTATIGIPFNLNSLKITVVGSINMDTYLNVPQLPHTGKQSSHRPLPFILAEKESIRLSVLPDLDIV